MNRTYKRLLSIFLMIVMLNSTIVYPVVAQGVTIAKSEKKPIEKNSKYNVDSKNKKDHSQKENNNTKGNQEKNNKDKGKGKSKNKNNNENETETDRFIVKYKDNSSGKGRDKLKSALKGDFKESKKLENTLKGNIKKSKKLKKKDYDLIITNSKISYKDLDTLVSSDENIEYIVPDYKMKLMSNDTYYGEQWGLQYIFKNDRPLGIVNTTTGSAITSNNSTTSSAISSDYSNIQVSNNNNQIIDIENIQGDGVVIGIIDTGIDILHEDLSQNIWINEKEFQNGIDNDNNGYIDDIYGWNFVNNSNKVFNEYDSQSENHGTHIAGIIAALEGNGKGVAGVAPKTKIMSLKVFENGEAYTSDIIEAIEYAKNNNVKIMNCSWGNEYENPILREVIEESGMLFIFAAGNQGENIDNKPFYPASYDSENILTVGSINQNEELAYNSNYGQASVDVYAPGENIISILPNNQYGYMSGTSMATAFVSGEAALILGEYEGIEIEELKRAIVESASMVPSIHGGKVINCVEGLRYAAEKNFGGTNNSEDVMLLVMKILSTYNKVSELSKEDLNLTLKVYDFDLNTAIACEEKGYNLKDSINISVLVKKHHFTIEEIEQVLGFYDDYTEALENLNKLNMSKETLGLKEHEYYLFKKLYLEKYTVEAIESAFIVSDSIGIDIKKIILTQEELSKINNIEINYEQYSEEEKEILNFLLENYKVNIIKLLDISKEYGYSLEGLKYNIDFYHKKRLKTSQNQYSLKSNEEITDDEIEYEKYFNAPFSISSAGNESISPNNGNLTYEKKIVSLLGKNGLNLNINARYSLKDANLYHADYYVKKKYAPDGINKIRRVINEINDITYVEKHNKLGSGWSLGFSSIETNGDKYLNLSDGNKYKINITSTVGDSNLEKYTLNDMRIKGDNGTFSSGDQLSYYVLMYKDGVKEYFASDGRLLGIKDRYENTIKFRHKEINGHPVINEIIDTLGRVITINYDGIVETGKIIISIPDDKKVELLVEPIEGYSYDYVLKEIIDEENRRTTFDYTFDEGYFSFDKSRYPESNIFANLTTVEYSTGASTTYHFEKVIGNLGELGYYQYFRILSREDAENGKVYNFKEYSYEGEYTGRGSHNEPSNPPDTFKYKTTITNSNGINTTYTFNNKHLPEKQEIKENEKLLSEVITEYDSNKQPLKVINKTYNKLNDNFIKKVENYQYDLSNYGDLIGYWDVQANRNSENMPINDVHKATFEYNSDYHYVTSKSYKKDKDTIIKEEYIPYSHNKNIQFARVYGNGELKSQTEFIYDSYGNIIEDRKYYKDGNGNWTNYITTKRSYDDNNQNRINSGKAFNGAYLTKQWVEGMKDADGNILGNVEEEYKYDYLGNVKEKIHGEKKKVSYEYDKLGRITKEINPDLSFKTYQYNDITNSVLFTDEKGNKFKADYDSFGKLKYLIDVQSVLYNEITSEQYKNNGPFTATGKTIKECNYDLNMKLLQEIIYNENEADKGRITAYTYYNDGRLEIKEIKELDGTLLYYESYIYNDADPQGKYSSITKVIKGDETSPDIVTTSYIDISGNTAIVERNHDGKVYKDTFNYDYLGNKIQEKIARAYDEDWAETYTARYEYDYAGRLTKQYNIKGDYSSTEYDELGRVKANTDIIGNKLRLGNEAIKKYSTTFEYDNLGRVIKEKIPFKRENDIIYYSVKKNYYDKNGNLTEQKVKRNKKGEPEEFNKIAYQYNNRNMLMMVTTYDNGSTENYTQYFYDKLGNKLRMYTGLSQPLTISGLDIIIENGDSEYSVTKYEYDKYSNLTKRITPSNKEETYDKYNNMGKLLQKTDRNKNVIRITYDGINRIKTRIVTTPTGEGNTSVTYTYTQTGQIKTMISGGVTTEYLYDDIGRIKTEKDSTGIKKEYSYDAANNRKSFILSINDNIKSKIAYEYDKQNRLEKVFKTNNGVQEETASYTYDDNGNRKTLQYPNGVAVEYNYNLSNSLTELANKKGATVLSKYTYTYYLNGNREKEIEEREGQAPRIREFKYDGLGRLETETKEGQESVEYDYDDSNNRSQMKIPTVIQALPNNLQEVSYTYNGLNQLTNATVGSITAAYTYNGNGLRRSKTVNGTTINHIWDGQSIIAETDASGNIIAEYIRGINLIAVEKNNKKTFYLYNGHGDVVQLTDENGNVIKNYQYDAFGNEINIDQHDTNTYRYGGEYFDKETGLYYLRARNYDARIGRFTTEDSYWGKDNDALSLNLYTYCHNNPIIYVDPTGNQPEWAKKGMSFIKKTPHYKWFTKKTQEGELPGFYDLGGFDRDENGVYHAKQDGWQSWKYVGYNKFYDMVFDLATSMDKEEFDFSAGGEKFRLWLWKGDYLNLGAGAEAGIYYGGGPHWKTGKDYAMPMTLVLHDNEENQIYDWKPKENTWWITGFNPNYQNVKASNLTVNGTIDFSEHLDMWESFYNEYNGESMFEFHEKNYIVEFEW